MTSLTTLPLDVLREILQELTVQEVLRIGMACRALRDATEDHHVWLPRVKAYRALVPVLNHYEAPITTFPTEELKAEAIYQAKLTSRWQTAASAPQRFTTFVESAEVYFATLLPGGDCVVVVSTEGDISLRCVDKVADGSNQHLMSIVAGNQDLLEREGDSLEIIQVEALYTLDHGLLLSLVLGGHDDHHWREFQIFHVDTLQPAITTVRSIAIQESDTTILGVCAQGDVLACLYGSERTLYILIASLEHSATVVLKPEMFPGIKGCDLCMPSPHTLIIYGDTYIHVYHVPDMDLLASRSQRHAVSVGPFWTWTGCVGEGGFRPNITVWDESYKEPPTVHLVSEALMHVLVFRFTESPTRLEVESHRTVPIHSLPSQQERRLTLKCQKGVWHRLDGHENTFDLHTMSVDDPNTLGSIRFEIPQLYMGDTRFEGVEFDEVSGRMLFLSSPSEGSVQLYHMHIGDIFDA